MGQFGSGKVVSLTAAVGANQLMFQTAPVGLISKIFLQLDFTLKSTGAAFAGVVNTGSSAAAEGTDDIDLLLAAIISNIQPFVDAETSMGVMLPVKWRTLLGAKNRRDFLGTLMGTAFTAASSVPISSGSAKAFTMQMIFPLDLSKSFEDGGVFSQGSKRIKKGRMEIQVAALNPTVALANGSAVVGALAFTILMVTSGGSEAVIGPSWAANFTGNYQTDVELPSGGPLLDLFDADPAATNATTSYNVGDAQNYTPIQLGSQYQGEKLVEGGYYDITARSTPLEWLQDDFQFLELVARLGKKPRIQSVSGKSSLALMYSRIVAPPPAVIADVTADVGGTGPIVQSHPSPKSVPPGTNIPGEIVSYLPVEIKRGGTGQKIGSPEAAAQAALGNQQRTARAKGLIGLLRSRTPR